MSDRISVQMFDSVYHPTAPLSVFKLSLHDETSSLPRRSPVYLWAHLSRAKPQNTCQGKRRAARFLSLELGASLEVGVWDLELFAWALRSSKIEIRLIP